MCRCLSQESKALQGREGFWTDLDKVHDTKKEDYDLWRDELGCAWFSRDPVVLGPPFIRREEFRARETSCAARRRPTCVEGSIHGASAGCSWSRIFSRDNVRESRRSLGPSGLRQKEDRNRQMDQNRRRIRAQPRDVYSAPATTLWCR